MISLLAIDLATTGLTPKGHQIIELAAAEVDCDRDRNITIGETRHTRIQPSIPVSPGAARANGYTELAWQLGLDADQRGAAIGTFATWIRNRHHQRGNGGVLWLGQIPAFDQGFLGAAFGDHDIDPLPRMRMQCLSNLCLPWLLTGRTKSLSLQALRTAAGITDPYEPGAWNNIVDTVTIFTRFVQAQS